MYVFVFVCLCLYVCVCVPVGICNYVCVCKCMYLVVCVCRCEYLSVSTYICVLPPVFPPQDVAGAAPGPQHVTPSGSHYHRPLHPCTRCQTKPTLRGHGSEVRWVSFLSPFFLPGSLAGWEPFSPCVPCEVEPCFP